MNTNMDKKIVKIILINCLIIIICLSGCMKTPEDSIVTGHSAKKFQKAILQKATEDVIENCPSEYFDRFISKDNKVRINIEATIVLPEMHKVPVIKINPDSISDEKIKWAINKFMEGDEGYYPTMTMTKSEIESWILRLQSEIANVENGVEILEPDEIEQAKSNLLTNINTYKEMLINAPDEIVKYQTNLMLRPFSFYTSYDSKIIDEEYKMTEERLIERANNKEENLYLVSDTLLSNGKYARLTIFNEYPFSVDHSIESVFGMEKYQIQVLYSDVPFSSNKYYILERDPFAMLTSVESLDARYPDLEKTKQEAVEFAFDKLCDICVGAYYFETISERYGMENLDKYMKYKNEVGDNGVSKYEYYEQIDAKKKFYMITFRPIYYGIPLLEANQKFCDEEVYNSQIQYEEIAIRVAQNSIAEFRWTNPTDVSNVINENVKIISFSEALESAKKYMEVKYNLLTLLPISIDDPDFEELSKKYTDANINIKEIKFGLAGIPVYDSSDEYLLIPVWNFYGSYCVNSNEDGYSISSETGRLPIVSVNAIDGSIIQQRASKTY